MKLTSIFVTVLLMSTVLLGGLSVVVPNAQAVDVSDPPELVSDNSAQKTGMDTFITDSGRIYTVWNDRRGIDNDIYLSYSSNNGTTFTDDILVNSNTTGDQLYPKVAVNDDGVVFVVWQDRANDFGDIKMARSTDGGETFTAGATVNSYTNGTQQYPDIAVNGNDIVVVWEEMRYDNVIKLWNPDTGALLRELEGHEKAVRSIAYSPDDDRVVSGGEDNMAKVWNSQTGAFITNLTHNGTVTAVNWTTDGNIIATASWDYKVKLWSAADYSWLKNLYKMTHFQNNISRPIIVPNPVNSIALSPNATQSTGHLAAGYNGEFSGTPMGNPTEMFNMTVWNMSDSTNWTVNEGNGGHTNSVMGVAFSHNGTYVASCSKDDRVKIWNATSMAKFADVNLGRDVLSVCWSPDDTQLAAGLSNGTVVILNFTNPANRTWLTGHKGSVNALSWNEVRNELASGAGDPIAKVWDPVAGTVSTELEPHMNSVYAVDWTPSGDIIATASGNSGDMQEGEIFSALSTNGGQSFSDAVSVADSNTASRLRPKVGMDATGKITVVWYDSRNSIDQIYLANSTDGVSYNENAIVGEDLGKVQSLPDLAVERETGKVHVTWQYDEGKTIRYANSSDAFQNVKQVSASGQLPKISTSPTGSSTWIIWRYNDPTLKLNYTHCDVSYDGGASFADLTVLNQSLPYLTYSDLAVSTDSYDQTSFTWIRNAPYQSIWEVYHISTVLTDNWRPTITGTIPANAATDVSVFTHIQLNFSEPMDRQAVEDAFSISNGTVLGADDCSDIYWTNYSDKVIFTLTEPLDYLDVYVVTVATTAADISGNTIASPYVFSFNTRDDLDAPVIEHLQTIFEVGYDETYTVEATIIDWWGSVTTTSVYYVGVGSTSFLQLAMTHVANNLYTATIPAQNALGNVTYYIRATDNHGNSGVLPVNTSQHFNYSVVDKVPPEISHAPVTEWSVYKPVIISAHVEDEIELASVKLYYSGVNLSVGNLTMSFNGTSNFYETTIPAQNDVGTVSYWLSAIDGSGNQNLTENYSISITDLTVPLINSVSAEHMANQTEVLVRANVTDDVAVAEVTLFFKAVGGDHWVERNMPLVSGNTYEFTIPAQRRSGTIYYYVNATDTSGNLASTLSEADEFAIEVVGVGTNWTMYIILGVILAVLVVVLIYQLMKRAGGKKPKKQPARPTGDKAIEKEDPSTETEQNEDTPDEEVDAR